jgi:hypothetical protein
MENEGEGEMTERKAEPSGHRSHLGRRSHRGTPSQAGNKQALTGGFRAPAVRIWPSCRRTPYQKTAFIRVGSLPVGTQVAACTVPPPPVPPIPRRGRALSVTCAAGESMQSNRALCMAVFYRA